MSQAIPKGMMRKTKLIKVIAAAIMLAFGVIVSLNWFHTADGEPGWIAWIVIVLSPLIYPAMAWILLDRFLPRGSK